MKKMTEGGITGHLIGYALPMIFGNIFQLTYNAVDSIIIGKAAGEAAVAAVAAANPVMTILILGVSGLCIGASVLMSEFYGSGDGECLKKEIATTLVAGGVFSAVVLVLGFLISGLLLLWMNVPADALDMAMLYLRIIFVGFPFTFLYNALSSALRSVGDAGTPVKFLMLASVCNGLLDVVFVCLLELGVAGAALATVIAEGLSAVLCLVYVYRHIPMLRILPGELKADRELLKRTLRHGCVTALQQSCQPVGKALIQGCINQQGTSVIAAFNAVNRVDDFAFIPEQSISHGMMTCVAQNRGAGNSRRVQETLKKGLMLEVLYWVCICAVTLVLRTPVMKLFAPPGSTEMIRTGVEYLTIMAFLYVMPGFTNGLQGFFRGMGNMKATLAGTAIQIFVRAAFVYILVPRMGMTGAAYACMAGWTLMLLYEVPYYFYCKKYKWAN